MFWKKNEKPRKDAPTVVEKIPPPIPEIPPVITFRQLIDEKNEEVGLMALDHPAVLAYRAELNKFLNATLRDWARSTQFFTVFEPNTYFYGRVQEEVEKHLRNREEYREFGNTLYSRKFSEAVAVELRSAGYATTVIIKDRDYHVLISPSRPHLSKALEEIEAHQLILRAAETIKNRGY